MPFHLTHFKKKNRSSIVDKGGPSPAEQLAALVSDCYWTVLNPDVLGCGLSGDPTLTSNANALKFAIQTFGPTSNRLPFGVRPNLGRAQGHIFHGDFNDSHGTTYVLEWSVIDRERRIVALLGFATHENYPFRQARLSQDEIDRILTRDDNLQIIDRVQQKTAEAKAKVERMTNTYKYA